MPNTADGEESDETMEEGNLDMDMENIQMRMVKSTNAKLVLNNGHQLIFNQVRLHHLWEQSEIQTRAFE